MDRYDYTPRFSPIINGSPLRYSIGMYQDKKRVIIAWFADEHSAIEYLLRCRRDNLHAKFDYLQSLF